MKKLFFTFVNVETIKYILCGMLTALVNLSVFKGLDWLFGAKYYLFSNSVAWVLSIGVSFLSNKVFVFKSRDFHSRVVLREGTEFFSSRIATYFLEQFGLWLFVSPLGFGEKSFDLRFHVFDGRIVSKVLSGIVVVILNYLLSKFVIFKKLRQNDNNEKK